MHDTAKIIREWWIDTVGLEIVTLTVLDVTPVDDDVVISVWTDLFMMETNGVHELVMDDLLTITSRSQAELLSTT